MRDIKICPSILSANFCELKSELSTLKKLGIDVLHFDVMDGCFVPNISFGPCVLKSLSESFDMFFDVHLMVSHPLQFLWQFKDAGAKSISFHIEACDDILQCIKKIKELGCLCSIAIKPETDIFKILPFLDYLDMVLIMSVEPGFGGQKFIEEVLEKVEKLKQKKPSLRLQVDGGINLETAKIAAKRGVDWFVAGSFIFSSGDFEKAVKGLKEAIFLQDS